MKSLKSIRARVEEELSAARLRYALGSWTPGAESVKASIETMEWVLMLFPLASPPPRPKGKRTKVKK